MISRQHRASADLIAREKELPLLRSEYDRLVELGAFRDERVELLFGKLVAMSPQGAAHAEVMTRLSRVLERALGPRADVRSQVPLALSDDSEPEPDVMVIPPGDYLAQLPSCAHLVAEVADSSVHDDRLVKGALYAAAGIPEYWLVNLKDWVVEVYSFPEAGSYRDLARHRRGDSIRLASFPDIAIAVGEFLPERRS